MQKSFLITLGLCLCTPLFADSPPAQREPEIKPVLGRQIADRKANQRVVQMVSAETNQLGKVLYKTNAFTEMANGLNYRDAQGEWTEAEAKITVSAEGKGVALKGAHQATFAPNINSRGAVEVLTPDHKTLKSHVLGLAYYDFQKDQILLFAEVKDSVGSIVGDNVIVYEDAFTDVKADIRYTYTVDGMEQDIILRERPPLPETFGFNPKTTWMEVWTEFIDAPEPVIDRRIRRGWKESKVDKSISFGDMVIGDGTAFGMGDKGDRHQGIPVQKHWATVEGRTFLVEEVDFRWLTPQLRALPEGKIDPKANPKQASNHRIFPERREAKVKSQKTIQVASLVKENPGFVIDYALVNTTTNYTFQGDTTYFIRGNINLSGTTVIEGGAVIKYTNGAALNILGTLDCQTESYRPAILTSYKDNSVGETIVSGTPTNTYATTALYLANGGDIHNLHIRYADTAISSAYGYNYTASHSQFIHCGTAMITDHATFTANNILMYDVGTGFYGQWYHGTATHLTFDQGTYITGDSNFYEGGFGGDCDSIYYAPSSGIAVVNSLITAVSGNGIVPIASDHTTILISASGVYQTVGAASHYLSEGSTNRDAGTSSINTNLLVEMQKKTTYPPVVFSNFTFSVSTTLLAQAQRDSVLPDLGYHYDPLDYVLKNCTHSGGSLTFTNGVAIGLVSSSSSSPAFTEVSAASLISKGTPLNYNEFAFYNVVQEQSSTNWVGASGYLSAPLIVHSTSEDNSLYRFTRFSRMGGEGNLFGDMGNSAGNISFRDCVFQSAAVEFGAVWEDSLEFYLDIRNCLFQRSQFKAWGGYATFSVSFHNNLFWYCSVSFEDGTDDQLMSSIAYDNLFYHGSISPPYFDENFESSDYNAYDQNASPKTHDKILPGGFAFQQGALGRFYLPTGSALLNGGSQNATNADLYHYTTLTNQVKETNSTVDIGYHYVAVSNGAPIDSDGDGLPDYQEDANGDGSRDGSETDPNNPDTDYDGRSDSEEISEHTNPTDQGSALEVQLARWTFDNTNSWVGDQGQLPISSLNVIGHPSPRTNALFIYNTNGAYLKYRDLETNGHANINCQRGTLAYWFKPDWSSTSAGGVGPQAYGTMVSLGVDTPGFWGLAVTSDGNILSIATIGAGGSPLTVHAQPAINWNSNTWHQVVMTYSASDTKIYLDGQLAATGSGITNFPNAAQRANGLIIGDPSGTNQCRGQFEELETWNFELSALDISNAYDLSPLADADGDGVTDKEDAAPFDPTVGRLSITIVSPSNGATVY